ncbi:MAG: low molecular weight phosphotyrosine protein phosphatase [Kiritimatiellae bacterium]|nr:low molecular weight phosphotyrosine protein phosphatase [Kiritimatiellia bacterium]
MAEFVMKHLLAKAGRGDVSAESAALHSDELGSDIHSGTRRVLTRHGIPFEPRRAWLLDAAKASEYDLIVGMDSYNMADLRRLVYPDDRPKLHRMLEFAGVARDVADPWYTGDFDATYADVESGCAAILRLLDGNAPKCAKSRLQSVGNFGILSTPFWKSKEKNIHADNQSVDSQGTPSSCNSF